MCNYLCSLNDCYWLIIEHVVWFNLKYLFWICTSSVLHICGSKQLFQQFHAKSNKKWKLSIMCGEIFVVSATKDQKDNLNYWTSFLLYWIELKCTSSSCLNMNMYSSGCKIILIDLLLWHACMAYCCIEYSNERWRDISNSLF